MSEQEEWRPIPGFRDYVVSSLGQVASTKGGQFRILSGGKTEMGYRNVLLYQDGQRVGRRVHQLVSLVFHGPRPEGLQIRHLDGNQLNNAASNLTYGTAEENYWDKKLHNGTLLIVPASAAPIKRRKTHCKYGHEFTEANTYWSHEGKSTCKPCRSRHQAQSRARRRVRASVQAVSA